MRAFIINRDHPVRWINLVVLKCYIFIMRPTPAIDSSNQMPFFVKNYNRVVPLVSYIIPITGISDFNRRFENDFI